MSRNDQVIQLGSATSNVGLGSFGIMTRLKPQTLNPGPLNHRPILFPMLHSFQNVGVPQAIVSVSNAHCSGLGFREFMFNPNAKHIMLYQQVFLKPDKNASSFRSSGPPPKIDLFITPKGLSLATQSESVLDQVAVTWGLPSQGIV